MTDLAADVVMGDADPADAYADGGGLDPVALAAWLHELRRDLSALAAAAGAGLDQLVHFWELPNVDVAFADALAIALVNVDLVAGPMVMHDVLRSFDPTLPDWVDLSDDERAVASGVVVELIDWLQAEGVLS
jgi:hypothetical protein